MSLDNDTLPTEELYLATVYKVLERRILVHNIRQEKFQNHARQRHFSSNVGSLRPIGQEDVMRYLDEMLKLTFLASQIQHNWMFVGPYALNSPRHHLSFASSAI